MAIVFHALTNYESHIDAVTMILAFCGMIFFAVSVIFAVFLLFLHRLSITHVHGEGLLRHAAISSLFITIVFALSVPMFFFLAFIPDSIRNDSITKKFEAELREVPGAKEVEFAPFEGLAIGAVKLPGKGIIRFHYSSLGARFYEVDGRSITFRCLVFDNEGNFKEPADGLKIGVDKELDPWFPYVQLRTIKDVAVHYDELVASLDNIPNDPPYTEHIYDHGAYYVLNDPDPAYRVYVNRMGKRAACDVYTLKRR